MTTMTTMTKMTKVTEKGWKQYSNIAMIQIILNENAEISKEDLKI